MKNCIVIGGGVIGLCSAYYLNQKGHKVTVIDKTDMKDGCSYGNAGMIVPSHLIPMAQPGMIAQGMKWMFNPKSPFYIRPRVSTELISWGYQFYKHANKNHVESSIPALRDLSLLSKELYQDFSKLNSSFDYQEKGLLMLYKTYSTGEEEIKAGELAQKMGLEVDFHNRIETGALEKNIELDVLGSVHYKSDAHLIPNNFLEFLKKILLKNGVEFKTNTLVQKFKYSKGKIESIQTEKGVFKADEFILSAGSWSPKIAKMLGISIQILPGKGYSFNRSTATYSPSIPSILCEGKVAVTPMGNQVRFGGTLEITHTNDQKINSNRLKGIVETVNSFYPSIKMETPNNNEVWSGFRPCSPTGLPLISRSKQVENLILATGHAMMGLSLAPATGKIVQEIVDNQKTSVSIEKFLY